MPPAHWPSPAVAVPSPWPVPPVGTAMGRGLRCRCPACGQTPLFAGFLRVAPVCAHCSAPLGLARADDAPPYFTIVVVGHIVVALLVLVQRGWNPSSATMTAIFLPLTLVLSLALLRPIKGATVGVMLTMGLMKPAPIPG
ncbi:MAG: DUF983 domain-containing protein [Acetobacteraceae bacterium]